MKLWKKGISLVMALGLSVSAAGCFADSSSENRTGITLTKDVAMTNLTETFETTKSFKVDLDCEYRATGENTITIDGEIIVSLGDDGADMKATITTTETDGNESEKDTLVVYFIDDYAYNYDVETKTYIKSTMSLSDLIEGALSEAGLTSADINAYVAELETALTEAGVTEESVLAELKESAIVYENVMSWSVDYKDEVNSAIDFLGDYDTNKTLEAVLNEALTAAGVDKDVDAILDGVGALGTLKVGDAVAVANAYLTLYYQTNLQAVLDAALADEAVLAALQGAGVPAEMITQLKGIKISDLVTAYGEMTIDEVLTMLTAGFETEAVDAESEETQAPTITLQSFADMAKSYLENTKISDLNENIVQAQAMLKAIDVTAFGGNVAVTYNGEANVMEIALESRVDIAVVGVGGASFTFGAVISEFSASAITIALPADATEVKADSQP